MKMKRLGRVLISMVFIVVFAGGVLNDIQPAGSLFAQSDSQILRRKGVLLFFLNPGGGPCQLQAQILKEHQEAIEKRFVIKAVATSDPSARQLFYRFGIRGLPSIVLLRSDGTLYRRLPPGVIPGEYILKVIEEGQ